MKTNRKHMKIYLFQAFKKIQILKNDTSFFSWQVDIYIRNSAITNDDIKKWTLFYFADENINCFF